MSASISLLRSRRKAVEDCGDSGEESDCSIKDPKKKESIEKDARAIAAINMLTVSMVNQLLEQQGLDPFGKSLDSPSLDDDQSWGTPLRTTNRPRSIKENTLTKKSRKSVRFTPDNSRTEFTPERSCDSERLDLTHTRAVSTSALKMEPKFTPLRRSKALKAGLLRSLENEQDISCVDNFACPNDSFDSLLPVRNLALSTNSYSVNTLDNTPVSDVKCEDRVPEVLPGASQQEPQCSKPTADATLKESTCALASDGTLSEVDKTFPVLQADETKVEGAQDQNDVCETPVKPRWTHHFDPTSPEHMSPFLKTLLEEREERGQGKEISKSLSMLEDSEDQPRLFVLKGVIAFVEVRKGDEDRSSGFRWKLKQLGAQVEENFTKKVTHVVFQEGLLSTYRKAKESNVHLVSAVWVMACDESSTRAPEDKYPIDEEEKYSMLAPLKKYIRRTKLISPNLGDDDNEKRLARRLQAIKRRSMKIEETSATESNSNDVAAASAPKENSDSMMLVSKRASLGRKPAAALSGSGSGLMKAWLAGKKKQDDEKDEAPEAPTSVAESTAQATPKLLRNRASDVKFADSRAKQKATIKSPVKAKLGETSFDSPVTTKSTLRFVDSRVTTKSSSRVVDSPVKTKPSSRLVDSPVKTKSTSKSVDSPVKTKSSSRFVDSPLKTKSSSRFVDSPVKTKPSSRLVDSPVKTKSTSKSVDSPVKTKSSSRFVDSPVKTKSSSRVVDSPLKTKSSSRFIDSPVKTKSAPRTFDSPAKAKSDVYFSDSPKKPKLNDKVIESVNSTAVASPGRPKVSSKTRSPSKCDLIKESHTTKKRFSWTATSTVTSERSLRSTPTKSAVEWPSNEDIPLVERREDIPLQERRTPPKTKPGKSSCEGSITGWLTANNASLTSPAKRSLSGAFKGLSSNPARRSKGSTPSSTEEGSKYEPVLESVAEAGLKSPELFEAPKKKARVGPTPKKSSEEAKKQASSETAKPRKHPSGGPSQSKDKKKISPRGKAAMKRNHNDRSQTVLTSHFRLVVSPKEEPKVKTVTEEPCGDISEHKAVLVLSPDVQTSAPQNGDVNHVGPKVADTNDDIDSEMPLTCPSIAESENKGSVIPVSTDAQETTHVPHQSENVVISVDEWEPIVAPDASQDKLEARASAEAVGDSDSLVAMEVDEQSVSVAEEPASIAEDPSSGVEEPAFVAEDLASVAEEPASVAGKPASGVEELASSTEEPRTMAAVCQEPPTTEDETAADMRQESRVIEDVTDKQLASADSSKERISTHAVDNQQPISAVSVDVTPLVSEEQAISADSEEEKSATPVMSEEKAISADSVENRGAAPAMSEEQAISSDSVDERSATPVISEEQAISADSVEDRGATPVISEEQTISADSVEDRGATPVISEEQTISADSVDERSATPVISEEQAISADSVEDRGATRVISEEQAISADSVEDRGATPVISEEQTISADSVEDRGAAPAMGEEQAISSDSVDERSATPVISEEQAISADSVEERSKTSLVSEEQAISAASVEERGAIPLVSEEQATSVEERSVTPLVSEEQSISTVSVEESGSSFDSRENSKSGGLEDGRTLSNLSEDLQVPTDKSSGSVSRDAEGGCDSFSSLSTVNSVESAVKKVRKSHYRTRRSTRFLPSDIAD